MGPFPEALELGAEPAVFFAAEACARAGKEPLLVSFPALACQSKGIRDHDATHDDWGAGEQTWEDWMREASEGVILLPEAVKEISAISRRCGSGGRQPAGRCRLPAPPREALGDIVIWGEVSWV